MSALPAEKLEKEVVTSALKGRRPQARSLERRKKIMDAARELITLKSVSSLSLYDIARKAEIPPSSLYHFFPKIELLFQALAEESFAAFDACVSEPLPPQAVHHWSDVGYTLEARMVQYYQQNDMARALILGQHLHSDILAADHKHDDRIGKQIEQIYRQYFQLPPLPEGYNIFAIALQIADKVYAMSHQEYGNITPAMACEGWLAARSYLGIYLPDQLQRAKQAEGLDMAEHF
ncbi:TetR/AcrR family transcriptional regulator [Endozoicomonas gorgoniicola]|uniref:TetR/AcrR family transcriptional regulator n=1 Tax=Endozoicomonas gorgoniicola TaxID=1234144 RepID=A0ABT3N1Q8_9GAMM|nr:TetR/AcrR family transcriptional regulator [Endozoicomonas gorgoniicola]MCW7555572.1 TetR/AcrR family transcriptional regulator [Endozoicomonas gorgoniicola]